MDKPSDKVERQAPQASSGELLFVAKTNDETLDVFSELREEDIRKQIEAGKELTSASYVRSRIRTSYISDLDAITHRRNFALKEAKGRWIAFLDAGDVWEPTKLERQIGFMEKHGYAFSYTQYGIIDRNSHDRGFVIGGKEKVTYRGMLGKFLLTNGIKWRYEVYRIEFRKNPVVADGEGSDGTAGALPLRPGLQGRCGDRVAGKQIQF